MSFDIALSGIQAINEALDVTSNNIANAGTYGYKAGRANFSSLVSGNQPTGTHVGSVTQNIGLAGGVLNTGRSLDAAINGRGFFVTKDASGQTDYTRVGIFDVSKDGFVVDASGRKVQGFTLKPPSTTLGAEGDLPVPTGQIPAVISDKVSFVSNLSSDWPVTTLDFNTITPATPPDPSTFSMSKATVLYDTLGGQHTLTQYFSTQSPGVVQVAYAVDGTGISSTQLTMDPTTGQMTTPDPADPAVNGSVVLDLSGVATTSGATLSAAVTVNYTGTTYFAGEATTSTNNANGYASGTFSGVDLGTDGSVIAKYTNGQKQTVGMIAIATFPDESALTQIDNTSWAQSSASGTPLTTTPGVGMAGSLSTSSLEQSNVDITSELVGLMTSQRNYQANSKVIQTESTMMQSLMQAI